MILGGGLCGLPVPKAGEEENISTSEFIFFVEIAGAELSRGGAGLAKCATFSTNEGLGGVGEEFRGEIIVSSLGGDDTTFGGLGLEIWLIDGSGTALTGVDRGETKLLWAGVMGLEGGGEIGRGKLGKGGIDFVTGPVLELPTVKAWFRMKVDANEGVLRLPFVAPIALKMPAEAG